MVKTVSPRLRELQMRQQGHGFTQPRAQRFEHFFLPVLDDAGRAESPLHHLCGELVVVAEVGEADDVVARLRDRPNMTSTVSGRGGTSNADRMKKGCLSLTKDVTQVE